MPRREPRQLLSRVRVEQVRAAEILRILHESPPGLGDQVFLPRIYDRLVDRRAIDLNVMYDFMQHDGRLVRRPSMAGIASVRAAVNLLLAMNFVCRLSDGVYAITQSGRSEARTWFPELPTNDIDSSTPIACGHSTSA